MRNVNKTHDTLGRLLRHVKVENDKQFLKRDTDLVWYCLLHHIGDGLDTRYLIVSTRPMRKSDKGSKGRMATLFKEDRLTRRRIATRSTNPLADPVKHFLTDSSRSILAGNKQWSDFAPVTNSTLEHHLMAASIVASFMFSCRDTEGFSFTPQHATFKALLEIPIGATVMRPDGGFLIGAPGTDYLCFLEADRGNEPATSKKKRKTLEQMVEHAKALIVRKDGKRLYQEHFKLEHSRARYIFITTTEAKRAAFLKLVEKHFPNGCQFILTHVVEDYGEDYRIPDPMDMLDVDWVRYYPDKPIFRFKPQGNKIVWFDKSA